MNIKEILEGKRIIKVKSDNFDPDELKLYLDDGTIFTIYPQKLLGYRSMKITGNVLGHDIAVDDKLKEDEWKLE